MTDQATIQQLLPSQQPRYYSPFSARVIAITSGKGGVGKSNVIAGLAMSLAKTGQRTVILDADFGLANADVLLGVTPKYTLQHVLRGERVLEEVILEAPHGVRLIPASSGIQELTRLDGATEIRLVQGLQRVAENTDWLLIDTAAGIHDSVIKLLMAAQEVILVVTPEPPSLIDAFAMIRVINLRDSSKPIWLLVNSAQSEEEAEETIDVIQAAAHEFLGREVNALGMIPSDTHVHQAVRLQQCVVDSFPDSPASKAFQTISKFLIEKIPLQKGAFSSFWKQLSQA